MIQSVMDFRRLPVRHAETSGGPPCSEAVVTLRAMIDACNLAGATELGRVLGIRPNTVNAWRQRDNGFPAPLATLKCGAVWDVSAVIAWADATKRAVVERDYVAPLDTPQN